jgi:hypothetical protein
MAIGSRIKTSTETGITLPLPESHSQTRCLSFAGYVVVPMKNLGGEENFKATMKGAGETQYMDRKSQHPSRTKDISDFKT